MRRLALLTVLTLSVATMGCFNPMGVENSSTPEKARALRMTSPAPTTGLVTVVHGVPGLTVDVYVNGGLTLPNFAPGTVTDALELAEDNYDIAIVPAGGSFPGDAVITGSTFLPAGANASIVANLAADGTPSLNVFVNDVSRTRGNRSRVVVRHVAQAGAVDVRLLRGSRDGRQAVLVPNLSNPNEAQADVRSRRYVATISGAGASDPLFVSNAARLRNGKSYIFYAIGDPSNGTFDVLVQTIALNGDDDDEGEDDDRDRGRDDDDDDDDRDDDDDDEDEDDDDENDDDDDDDDDEDDD